jgi:hypothetical protein
VAGQNYDFGIVYNINEDIPAMEAAKVLDPYLPEE